jgi:hypothetical protein
VEEGWRRGRRNGLLAADRPFRMDFMGKALLWFLEPPARMRTKTPPPFIPAAIEQPARVLPDFLEGQRQILEAIAAGDGLALDRIRIVSPFESRVKYSVWSSFRIAAANQRRHLWQAENRSA